MLFFKKKKTEDDAYRKIVIGADASSRITEGYNRLKDNILYMSADGKNKVIQVESAGADEGKTTLICNLAVSLGQTNKKVVVVDLDFRRPKAYMLFGLEKENGISEYILGKVSKKDIIKKTDYENVDVITSGERVHNPSLVLVSDVFAQLIASLREQYDYVLLDCAPVLNVSDYIHVSKVSDGVLFVVAYAKTTKSQVNEAVKELKRNNINILGTVFSMYDRKKDNDKYYEDYFYSEQNDSGDFDKK